MSWYSSARLNFIGKVLDGSLAFLTCGKLGLLKLTVGVEPGQLGESPGACDNGQVRGLAVELNNVAG